MSSSQEQSQSQIQNSETELQKNTKTDRLIGQVKWFNNKAGYGFITISDVENTSKDIFAHFSTIRDGNIPQYKYLVQGEYVEFNLTTSNNSAHEFQATNISGINGGMLMCEARQSNRPVRIERTKPEGRPETRENVSNTKISNRSSRPPRESIHKETDGFQTVRKKRDNVTNKK
jgi:cold shock CspA family protein